MPVDASNCCVEEFAAHIWLIKLELGRGTAASLYDSLSQEEISRAGRFQFPVDHDKFVMRRSCYRQILSRYTTTAADELNFFDEQNEKPRLLNGAVQFSTSHSADYAAIAICGQDIGLDLEQQRAAFFREPGLKKTFMTGPELALLETLSEVGQEAALFDCWTLKEAYLKGLGLGLSVDPREFSIDFLKPTILRPAAADTESNWQLYQLQILTGYSLAVAVAIPDLNVTRFEVLSSNLVALT